VKYVAACNRGGIEVLPPDVNSSGKDFTAVGETIRFGLAGIRGVGEGVVETIIAAREAGGPFTSLTDFCNRVDMRQCNKRTLEALIKAGAFDSTGYTRKHLMTLMDSCVDSAAKKQKDAESGQVTMFDLLGEDGGDHGFTEQIAPPNGDEWERKMKLAFEKEMLGIYVSDHPLREMADDIRAGSTATTAEVSDLKDGTMGWFAGMIASVDRRPTRTGKMMALLQIEDLDGSIEAVLFPQVFERYRDLITEDAVWRFRAKVENSDRGSKLIVQDIEPLVGRVIVHTDEARLANGTLDRLKDILRLYPGRDVLEIHVDGIGSTKMFRLQEGVDRDAHGLHAELIEVFGAQAVREL